MISTNILATVTAKKGVRKSGKPCNLKMLSTNILATVTTKKGVRKGHKMANLS